MTVQADEVLTEQHQAIIEQIRARSEAATHAAANTKPDPALFLNPQKMEEGRREALRFFEELQSTNPTLRDMQERQAEKSTYTSHRTLIFASHSLGEEGLDDLLTAVAGDDDVVVVFRGIPEGMSLGDGLRALQSLAATKEPVPNIIINPTLFEKHNVRAVPTIIFLEKASQLEPGGTAKELARVAGLADPAWLAREVAQGQTGDLGVRGPLAEIAEPDLIEVMKERVANIDWEAQKRQAIGRFWQNQRFEQLPRAPRPRTRTIDPSIIITKDIVSPNGQLIVAEGTRVNPLDVREFTQAVVVFDPLDKKQLGLLERELPTIRKEPGVQRVTFIATRFDRDEGWDSYKRITDQLDAPVFLLTPELIARFELAYTPSVITAQNRHFLVRELAEEGESE